MIASFSYGIHYYLIPSYRYCRKTIQFLVMEAFKDRFGNPSDTIFDHMSLLTNLSFFDQRWFRSIVATEVFPTCHQDFSSLSTLALCDNQEEMKKTEFAGCIKVCQHFRELQNMEEQVGYPAKFVVPSFHEFVAHSCVDCPANALFCGRSKWGWQVDNASNMP